MGNVEEVREMFESLGVLREGEADLGELQRCPATEVWGCRCRSRCGPGDGIGADLGRGSRWFITVGTPSSAARPQGER